MSANVQQTGFWQQWREICQMWRDEKFLYGMFAGIALIIVGALVGGALFPADEGYKTNLYTELISVITTIVILDRLNERRQRQRETRELKARLIREFGSRVNNVALNATEELRQRGWLTDGSLRGTHLRFTDLSGAGLMLADLSDTHLNYVNLTDAYLRFANLSGAHLWKTNLSGAYLRDANLSGAHLTNTTFDENTILPDSDRDRKTKEYTVKWTPDTDMTRYTDPDHPNFWQPDWAKDDPASE